jgi:3-dehydroquinate synthase
VAAGCALAFRYSAAQGLCPDADVARVEAALIAAGLPTRLSDITNAPMRADRLIAHMVQDKKAEGGAMTLVLARRIGEAYVAKGVDPAPLRDFLVSEGAIP